MAELDVVDLGRDVAVISKELRAVLAELDAIPDAQGKAPADEIARRREDRRKKASTA